MSKKFIILIQLVVCVIAVIMISLYGRNPEMWRDFEYCEEIYFIVNNERVDNGTEIEISADYANGGQYQLVWYVGPEDATNKTVRFDSNSANVTVDPYGLVTFVTDDGATIRIYTTDKSLLSASIQLTILPPDGGELPF